VNLSRKSLHRPSILYQAAVLPWRRGKAGIEIMLITSLGSRRWVLPKGTLMPGESVRAAARREALEEAGLEGTLQMRSLGSFYYEKRDSGVKQLCSVEVYPLLFSGQREVWPERGRRRTEWFSQEKAAEKVDESDLKDMILAFDPARPGR
jgi:8-oxo-dGTP pyrophosphatase MutT (NUDIX family)